MAKRIYVSKQFGPMELYKSKRARPNCKNPKRRCGYVCLRKGAKKCSIKYRYGRLYRPLVGHGTRVCHGSQACKNSYGETYCIKRGYACGGRKYVRKVGPRAAPKECRGDTELCGRSCIPYYRACHIAPNVRPARSRRPRYPTLASLGLSAPPRLV